MPDNLETSQIRHLIFKYKIGGAGVLYIARTALEHAHRDGLISAVPECAYDNALCDKVLTVIWELILQGVYSPGTSIQNPSLPGLRLTDYGRQCFEAGELTTHDPDDYLKRLKAMCPTMDPTTLLYVEEALGSFRAGRFLAAVVMIGVASESMLLRLVDAVSGALDTSEKKKKFEQDTRKHLAKIYHDEVMKRFASPTTSLPLEIAEDLAYFVSGIFNLIRRTRNEAGHPTGKRLERNEANALLLSFPSFCERVEKLITWLAANSI